MKEDSKSPKNVILETTRELFKDDPDVVFGYLFGSYAAGRENTLSDIDIAVYLRSKDTRFLLKKERELSRRLTSVLNRTNVDLVLLNVVPLLLQYRVIKSGKVIVSKDEIARANYETKVMLRYFDLKPHLDEYDRELYRRIKSGAI